MMAGRAAATAPPNTKNSTTATSDDDDLGSLLVGADGAGQFAGQRIQAGEFDIAAVDLLEVGLNGLVVLQDGVVVIALERDADEGVPQILRLHLADGRIGGVGGAFSQPTQPTI